ncbi:uncharacterized protein [Euwallacea fornicatus]|uniref:uncharacterized protein isoform X2 n=1 Tax=Euwallacea fornicatus TaxID=995702 RepID=UPI00338FB32F
MTIMNLWAPPCYHIVKTEEVIDVGSVQQKNHPPSWEEVMNEKEKNAKREEKVPITDVEVITVNEAETLTATQTWLTMFGKILFILRKVVHWGTILFDLIFMSYSLTTLIVGCLILQKHYEIVRIIYLSQFSTIGHMMVVISSLNLGLFGPLGLIGAWKSKKSLLKWHNVWLLLNVLTHLIFLYMCFHFLQKSEVNRKETFKKSFESIYDVCYFNHTSGVCCCKVGKASTCWEYDKNPKNSLKWDGERFKHFDKIGGEDFHEYLEMHRIFGKNCDTDHTDYYGRTIKAMENGFLYLAGAVSVEGIALFFGTLTILITEYPDVEQDEEKSKKVEAKRQKNGLGVFKKVLIFFIVKRFFLFCLAGVFFLGHYSIKKVTENINIELPVAGEAANIKLWKLITSIVKF